MLCFSNQYTVMIAHGGVTLHPIKVPYICTYNLAGEVVKGNNALNNAAACSTPSAARLMDILKKFNTDAKLAVLHSI